MIDAGERDREREREKRMGKKDDENVCMRCKEKNNMECTIDTSNSNDDDGDCSFAHTFSQSLLVSCSSPDT